MLLGLYIVVTPFLPQLTFWLRDKSPTTSAPYDGALAASVGSDAEATIPADNRLVIPSIQLNESVFEGGGIWVIRDGGTWHRPGTSDPDQGGNTVIVGHRFYGSDTSTFYHLDKVTVGQKLALYWEGKEILYEVAEIKVVGPSSTEIEAPTNEPQLTIYTCTPLWSAKQRLVVIAKPVEGV